jgi:hypothetical protein
VSLGSFSEASRVFDAELLKPILEEIGEQLTPLGRDRRLADVPHTLTLVDGTLLSAQQFPASAEIGWIPGKTTASSASVSQFGLSPLPESSLMCHGVCIG